MGHKSKFTFPVSSRKPKEPPTISAPLSKVQKLLGTGEINIDPTSARNGNARSWDARSTEGISISVSDISARQATNDNGYGAGGDIDNGRGVGGSPGHLGWEQESAVIPRGWWNAPQSNSRALNVKKSTGALSADYPYATADDYLSLRRQESSSTIHTHYEKGNVPLSVSQQTSNSAIARGLPRKARALLDVEGDFVNRSDSKKKKPPKLDLLMLAGKHRKHHENLPPVGPVLGNNYVMKSPSTVSLKSDTAAASYTGPQHSPTKITKAFAKADPGGPNLSSVGPRRLRTAGDTTHQLSDHYEQMLARYEPLPDPEHIGSPMESTICGSPMATPSFFAPLAAPSRQMLRRSVEKDATESPLENSTVRGSTISSERFFIPLAASSSSVSEESRQNWTHTRRKSQESEAFTFGPVSIRRQPLEPAAAKNDYASSISSRYTRTSKASRTDKSILDADRQVTSVLSLSDSDSDGDDDGAIHSATRSSPLSQRSFQDELRTTASVRRPDSSRLSRTESRASNRSQTSSFANLNDYLTIPQPGSNSQSSRSRPDGTVRSENSPTSTIPPDQATSLPSPPSSSHDMPNKSTKSSPLAGHSRDSDCTIRQARVVSIQPVASPVKAASLVSNMEMGSGPRHHAALPQRPATRASGYSRASDQPTPPMSPLSSKSVEIYLETPEPAKKDVSVHTAETSKSRFMAVTKQEEMLLAALRNKRAMMRENIIAELGEGKGSEGGGLTDSPGNGQAPATLSPAQDVRARLAVPAANIAGHPPKSFPRRGSSLLNGKTDSPSGGRRLSPEQLQALRHAGSHQDAGDKPTLIRNPSPMETKTRGRVLMYLERPPTSLDQSESSVPEQGLDTNDRTTTDSIISEGEKRQRRHDDSRPPSRPSSQGRQASLSRQSSLSGSSRGSQKQPPVLPRACNPSRPGNGGLAPPLPIRLKEVPEEVRGIDDEPSSDENDSEYDSEDGEIDIDAFPAPASHQSVFGGALKTWGQVGGSQKDKGLEQEEKETAKPDSPTSHTSAQQDKESTTSSSTHSGHIRGKKSAVRLSAVGRVNSFSPWLGDDD